MGRPRLTIEQILAWAKAHHDRTGKWPGWRSGEVVDAPGETWVNVAQALSYGRRGLSQGRTLAQLLEERFGVRNKDNLPNLSEDQILGWAQAHHQRTGRWPSQDSGAIVDAPAETWLMVLRALAEGKRGLKDKKNLSELITERLQIRMKAALPDISEAQILEWAKHHREQTGDWPKQRSGDVLASPREKWNAIDGSLWIGARSLAGGTTLRGLLEKHFDLPKAKNDTPLTVEKVLEWAKTHKERTGEWPGPESGIIPDTDGETWKRINSNLYSGKRNLPSGLSLKKLLEPQANLDIEIILRWILAHRERTGDWPLTKSGVIQDAPSETWARVDALLRSGGRGLSGGSSLAKVLAESFGVEDRRGRPSRPGDTASEGPR